MKKMLLCVFYTAGKLTIVPEQAMPSIMAAESPLAEAHMHVAPGRGQRSGRPSFVRPTRPSKTETQVNPSRASQRRRSDVQGNVHAEMHRTRKIQARRLRSDRHGT